MRKEKKSRPNYIGEQLIVLPNKILQKCERLPLVHHLFIKSLGIFPNATNHFYSREENQVSYAILLHCFDGEGWIVIRNKKLILKPGDAFLIPPLVAHSYGASTINKPWSIFWMHITGNEAMELTEVFRLSSKEGLIRTIYSEKRTSLFNQIFNTLSKGFSVASLLYANLVLPNYIGTFASHDSFNNLSPESQNNFVNSAISYMQERIEDKLTVENMARAAGVSSSYFFKQFKKNSGYSPLAYFNFLKIQKAIQLIHSSKKNISEIGSQIGIDDPYYFSRLFKKQMGVSPRKYMHEFRTGEEQHQ